MRVFAYVNFIREVLNSALLLQFYLNCWRTMVHVKAVFWLLATITLSSAATEKASCLPDNERWVHIKQPKNRVTVKKNRFDCHPEDNPSQERCEARGCCWDGAKRLQPGPPTCSFPENYGGYVTVNITDASNGKLAFMERVFPSPYPDDVKTLRADSEYLTDSILRVKVTWLYHPSEN